MKNIQVVDSAVNTTFSLFQATDEEFALLFPQPGQDMEYGEDLARRPDKAAVGAALQRLSERPVRKQDAMGIHGTLLYGLQHHKKWYREKREDAVDASAVNRAQRRLFGSQPSTLGGSKAIWAIGPDGMRFVPAVHDGTLIRLDYIEEGMLDLSIDCQDRQMVHVTLHGLRDMSVSSLCAGTIVFEIEAWRLTAIPNAIRARRDEWHDGWWSLECDPRTGAPGPLAMADRALARDPDGWLVVLSSSFGGDLAAICDRIDATDGEGG